MVLAARPTLAEVPLADLSLVNRVSGADFSTAGTGTITSAAPATFTFGNNLAGRPSRFAGTISGSLSVAVKGTNPVTLTGDSTYSGTTTIRDAGTQLRIGGGGTTGSLGTGAVANGGELLFDRSDAITVANAISGSGSLTKSGAGNLVLSGSSTYTGPTTVSAGRLSVDGILGTTPVAVLAAAELGGSGAIGGPLSVAGGGSLAPGNSIASLATGTVSFAAAATFAYEVDSTNPLNLGTAADLLVVSGDLNLDPGNGSLLSFADITSGTVQPFVEDTTVFAIINYSGSWNGGLFTYNGTPLADGSTFTVGSQQWQIDYNSPTGGSNYTSDYLPSSSFVTVMAVPEPGTLALAAASVGLVAFAVRRRRALP